jgi:translation elongation factor P/translation initiation factor 5A|tara:strand:+ start:227 stop:601 length:375 start_codon:yes stop_codon:yes gene_type:complete
MTEAKELKAGNYVRINNEILKVVRKEIVAYGTHSHSKTKLFVQGLFSKGEKSINMSHHDNVEMVDIVRKQGQILSLTDKAQVMDNVSYETVDADVEPGLIKELNEGDIVTFINFEGKAMVLEKR